MASSAELSWVSQPLRSVPLDRARSIAARLAPQVRKPPADALASLVSDQVIPRLIHAHGGEVDALRLDERAVIRTALLALEPDPANLLAEVDTLLAEGTPFDRILVDRIAPVARRLGEWWEEDRCDFSAVTIGLWRLQQLVRDLSARLTPPRTTTWGKGRALFSAFPGDQHDFGAVMVSELFDRDGWEAELLVAADMSALLAAAAGTDFDLIGLTLSCDCHSARLSSTISALRSVSRNPAVCVIVGGRVLNADPGLAERAGADGTAADAQGALLLAEELVGSEMRGSVLYG